MTDRPCQRPGCDNLIPSRKRRDARWCSRRCEGRATRAAKRLGIELADYGKPEKLLPVGDQSLVQLHERARAPRDWRDDPRAFSDFGDVPGDAELAAEIDAGVYDEQDEQTARFHALVEEDADRTPRETWRKWRAYGRRHGSEHPEQTADRIERHRAAEAAKAARIDGSTAGRIQDRFDTRTASTVATNARESRRLNVRHAEQPPVSSPAFDFQAEQTSGGPYRQGLRSRAAVQAQRLRVADGRRVVTDPGRRSAIKNAVPDR